MFHYQGNHKFWTEFRSAVSLNDSVIRLDLKLVNVIFERQVPRTEAGTGGPSGYTDQT